LGNNWICSLCRALLWPNHWAHFTSQATGLQAQGIYVYSLTLVIVFGWVPFRLPVREPWGSGAGCRYRIHGHFLYI